MRSNANRWLLPAMVVLTLLFVHSLTAEVQIGRYATVRALPTEAQRDVLSMQLTRHFDTNVKTVGDAVAEVLKEVGYSLSDPATADTRRQRLLQLPLPNTHRRLGPVTIRDMLATLAGPGWQLVEDPVDRLVTFDRCDLVMP